MYECAEIHILRQKLFLVSILPLKFFFFVYKVSVGLGDVTRGEKAQGDKDFSKQNTHFEQNSRGVSISM